MAKSTKKGTPIEQAMGFLQDAKDGILVALTGSQFASVRVSLDHTLNRSINQLAAISGNEIPGLVPVEAEEAAPVKSFFGREVDFKRKHVAEEDINPGKLDQEQFIAKRDELYGRFYDMSHEEIFAASREPMGVTLIRSIAKKAGVEDYRDAALDVTFIDTIKDALYGEQMLNDTVARADKGASDLKTQNKPDGKEQ